MSYVCILGRQPALGAAELESRFGRDAIELVQPGIALLQTDNAPDFNQLGGALKAAKLLTELPYTDWNKLVSYLQKSLPEHLGYMPDGKITLGLSVYGLKTNPKQINAAALSLKKIIKQAGRSARIVPNPEMSLNTAQVLHNKLTSPTGLELTLIKDGGGTILAQTVWVQDIEAYRRRDQERPMRDARVGMLPPKLAQIIINLAVNNRNPNSKTTGIPTSLNSNETKIPPVLLDPFCGTGVILQEASLQGYRTYGTDLDERMVDYSRQNLEWLGGPPPAAIEQADAASHRWRPFDIIACETYLGRPFSSQPNPETLQKVIHDVNTIHKKFLQNAARQTGTGFRMCIAVPAWHTKSGFKHLPVLDHLEELGYNRISFVHAETPALVYHREGQIVARELVVLTRK